MNYPKNILGEKHQNHRGGGVSVSFWWKMAGGGGKMGLGLWQKNWIWGGSTPPKKRKKKGGDRKDKIGRE